MKKKIVFALLTVMTIAALSGCGNNNAGEENQSGATQVETQTQESTGDDNNSSANSGTQQSANTNRIDLRTLDLDKIVVLGDYMNIPVDVEKYVEDQNEIDRMALDFYQQSITAENGGVMDRLIVEGDTANIDYCGKLDGVAFEGGTAEDTNLKIGSHTFIDGFEAQLIGAKPGESRDLNLTFPADYDNTDLAGKAVVFEVKVNYIVPTEMEDEVVKGFGLPEFDSVEALKKYVGDYLKLNYEEEKSSHIDNTVLTYLLEKCEANDVPEELLMRYKTNIQNSIEEQCAQYGVDKDTYCSYFYGLAFDDFLEEYGSKAAKQNLVSQAIANKENLNVSDEELDEKLMEYATMAGYSSIEELLGTENKEDYREYFMFNKVMDFLAEHAVITEK